MAIALNPADYPQELEEQESSAAAEEQKSSAGAIRREFQKRRREAVQKAQKKVVEQLAKKIAKKASLRTVSIASGSSGVGLLVTYAIWTGQLIFGNLLDSKIVPKLDLAEKVAWFLLGVLLGLILLIVLTIFVVIANKEEIAWETLTDWAGF